MVTFVAHVILYGVLVVYLVYFFVGIVHKDDWLTAVDASLGAAGMTFASRHTLVRAFLVGDPAYQFLPVVVGQRRTGRKAQHSKNTASNVISVLIHSSSDLPDLLSLSSLRYYTHNFPGRATAGCRRYRRSYKS